MGFKIQCISATVRPNASVRDHYLHQAVEVEMEYDDPQCFEEMFFDLWELLDDETINEWLAPERKKIVPFTDEDLAARFRNSLDAYKTEPMQAPAIMAEMEKELR